MGGLDDLPEVDNFFGTDLRTGAIVIAIIGIIHPLAYGCTYFVPLSYILVSIWILVAIYFAASVVLFFGIYNGDVLTCTIWVWYTLFFVAVMLMMMILLALVFGFNQERTKVLVTIAGMLWYILTIYFAIVVNSYRKELAIDNPKKLDMAGL